MFQRMCCSINLIAHVVSCGVCIHEAKDGLGTEAISAGPKLLAKDSHAASL